MPHALVWLCVGLLTLFARSSTAESSVQRAQEKNSTTSASCMVLPVIRALGFGNQNKELAASAAAARALGCSLVLAPFPVSRAHEGRTKLTPSMARQRLEMYHLLNISGDSQTSLPNAASKLDFKKSPTEEDRLAAAKRWKHLQDVVEGDARLQLAHPSLADEGMGDMRFPEQMYDIDRLTKLVPLVPLAEFRRRCTVQSPGISQEAPMHSESRLSRQLATLSVERTMHLGIEAARDRSKSRRMGRLASFSHVVGIDLRQQHRLPWYDRDPESYFYSRQGVFIRAAAESSEEVLADAAPELRTRDFGRTLATQCVVLVGGFDYANHVLSLYGREQAPEESRYLLESIDHLHRNQQLAGVALQFVKLSLSDTATTRLLAVHWRFDEGFCDKYGADNKIGMPGKRPPAGQPYHVCFHSWFDGGKITWLPVSSVFEFILTRATALRKRHNDHAESGAVAVYLATDNNSIQFWKLWLDFCEASRLECLPSYKVCSLVPFHLSSRVCEQWQPLSSKTGPVVQC